MPRLAINSFAGEMPRVDRTNLPDNYAQTALNVDIRRGAIEPAKAPLDLSIAVQASTQTIYLFNPEANGGNGFWFEFDSDVDVVRGPVADDTNLRTYWTGEDVPRFTDVTNGQSGAGPYPGASYTLGIPAPTAPTASGPGGSPPVGGQEISTAYVMTFVDQYGAEGPISPASNIVTRYDSGTVALTNLQVASGNFVILAKRIYRAELSGAFQFVAEISAAATTYDDSVDSEFLGEVVPSADWVAPDSDMVGLTALPNGVLMGWFGNTLCFSEAFQPHAWPIAYRQSLDYDIVAAAVVTNGVVVVTKGKPYLVAGSSPTGLQQIKLDSIQPCVSKRSMVDMGSFAIYASNDGLVAAGGVEAGLITEPHILPEQWRSQIKPDSIHAYRYDDRYLAFYDNGVTQGSFTFHPNEGFRFTDEYVDTGYLDDRDGRLFVKQSTGLHAWDEGADKSITWRSKRWKIPRGESWGVCQIDADAYPVTFEYFTDGTTRHTETVTNAKAFRLPRRHYDRDMEFEIRGSNRVTGIQLTTSMNEVL